jgi:RND superfamily putative drug exporter
MRFAIAVIAFWCAAAGCLGVMAAKLPDVLGDHGLRPNGSYAKAQQELANSFHIPDEPVVLLFTRKETVSPSRFQAYIEQTLSRLSTIEGLEQLVPPTARADMLNGNDAYALLSFHVKATEWAPLLEKVRQAAPSDSDIAMQLAGKPVVQEDVNRTSRSDLRKAEAIGIPIAFLIIWLSFGGLYSSLIPIVVGGVGVVSAMGVMYGLGAKGTVLSIFVLNVIPMVGLALSIDFALIVVSRFREELRRAPADRALVKAMTTAGRAVVFSAVCVAFGLGATMFFRMPIFTSVALGALIVLGFSVLLTLTLVPALLWSLRARIAAESRPSLSGSSGAGIWAGLAGYVMKRPIRVAVLAAFFLLGCLLPVFRMQFAVPDETSLPSGFASREATERFAQTFEASSKAQAYIVYRAENEVVTPPEYERVQQLVRGLKMDKAVMQAGVLAATRDRVLVTVLLRDDPASASSIEWARRWERELVGERFVIGGEPKYRQEVNDEITGHLPEALVFLAVAEFAILFFAFRSLLLPVKTLLMNMLSLSAAFGLLVWLFEDGRFGLEPTPIAIMIPIFIFGMTFGISMDYGVFLLARIAELYRQTGDNDHAVQEGLAVTSRLITSAAAIMIAVTAPFVLASVSGVKQLGIGITAAVLLDATVVRLLLVPSLMKLIGRWNWYPG